jgi:electron transport complex protein RnfB
MFTSVIIAVAALSLLAVVFGLLLGYAGERFKVEGDPVADQVLELLPQTQCGQCGFSGCRILAEAIARDEAPIDACPPGGGLVVTELAELLGREVPHGHDTNEAPAATLARIAESVCIGCTKCIQACPVDAILGAAKQMHVVLDAECTGCEKCVDVCPVDCITMQPVPSRIATWAWPSPDIRKAA